MLKAIPSEISYPAGAEALVRSGLLDEATKETVTVTMEKARMAEAQDDPEAIDEGLAGAGIL